MKPRLETDIASPAGQWLSAAGWGIYSEVSFEWQLRVRQGLGDDRADIVATRGEQLAVVECKQALSFDLFAQAKRWIPYADLVWVAVPAAKYTDGRREAYAIAREYYGIGILELEDDVIVERVKPRVHRRAEDALLISLQPEHKTHAIAGTNRGGQFTAFRRTCEAVTAYVQAHPQCKLEEAVRGVTHHYRSEPMAVEAISKAIKKGLIPGLRFGWKQQLEYRSADAAPEAGTEGSL